MKGQRATFAALRVAGKFPIVHREVGVAVDFYAASQNIFQCEAMAFHDELVRPLNGGERAGVVERQGEGVVQAAGALQHGAAAAAPAQDRNPRRLARRPVDLGCDAVRVTHDDEMFACFPEAQRPDAAVLAEVQQRLVARQIFRRRGQS